MKNNKTRCTVCMATAAVTSTFLSLIALPLAFKPDGTNRKLDTDAVIESLIVTTKEKVWRRENNE